VCLTSVPIEIDPALVDPARLRQKRWCPSCDREVQQDEVVRGYQYDKDQYVALVSKAANALVSQGFLLADDVAAVVRNAARHWDYLASAAPSTAGADKR